MPMETICCHGNQSSNPISPETLCSLILYLKMCYMKYDLNLATDFREVWMEALRLTVILLMHQVSGLGLRANNVIYKPGYIKVVDSFILVSNCF